MDGYGVLQAKADASTAAAELAVFPLVQQPGAIKGGQDADWYA